MYQIRNNQGSFYHMKPTVLITGASHGIGKAAALKFAQEGYYVYLNCHSSVTDLKNVAAEIEAFAPSSCTLLTGDVSSSADVKRMFEEISVRSGGVDVLVNNAGTAHIGLLMDMSDDEWDHIIQTDLSSVFYCTRAALPYMVHKKSGHIINIGSVAGDAAYAGGNVYCATKAAVKTISDGLRIDVAPSSVRVTNIKPGLVETNFSNVRFHGDDARADKVYQGIKPLTGDDIADVAFYAASAPAHVQIAEVLVLATHQGSGSVVCRKA